MLKTMKLFPSRDMNKPLIAGYSGDITMLKSLYIRLPSAVLYENPKFQIKSESVLLKKCIQNAIIATIKKTKIVR